MPGCGKPGLLLCGAHCTRRICPRARTFRRWILKEASYPLQPAAKRPASVVLHAMPPRSDRNAPLYTLASCVTRGERNASRTGQIVLTDQDIYLFREGTHSHLHSKLGCRLLEPGAGANFAVWAPNAA